MIILYFFKFDRWKIIFIGHEEKACFAAYPNLENKSQKYAKSRDFWKNKESLGCTRSISCSLVGKIFRSIGNVCKLGEKCFISFFCGFKVLLPMNITCYYYLKVGLKEAAWSSSILRGREFCYVGAHSPKNLKIYLSCFSEVIGPCSLVDQPVSKFLQSHYRLSQPWQELILISIR